MGRIEGFGFCFFTARSGLETVGLFIFRMWAVMMMFCFSLICSFVG